MTSLLRALALLRVFWSTSVAAEAEYRGNFIVAAVTSIGNLVGAGFSLWLFYGKGAGFPGYSADDVLVVLGLFSVWTGVVVTVLTPNLSRLVALVTEGTLDFVLLRPADSQLQVSLRALSPWGLTDVVLGAVLVVVGLVRGDTLGPHALLAIVPLVSAAVLLYALWFMLATTAIWFTKVYNATEVLRGLMDAGRFPMSAYPLAYRFVFSFVVPVAFLTTVPTDALLGRASTAWLLGSPVVATVVFVACRLFWKRALASYSGASG